MESKVQNGQDATERRRPIALSAAPEARAKPASHDAGPQDPGDDALAMADDRSDGDIRPIKIAPMGDSRVVNTALRGHTLFHMLNLGSGEAEVHLSWLNAQGRPELVRMFTNRQNGFEIYRDDFEGAKVAVINLSPESQVQMRVILCP
jgi:hypothetical protein